MCPATTKIHFYPLLVLLKRSQKKRTAKNFYIDCDDAIRRQHQLHNFSRRYRAETFGDGEKKEIMKLFPSHHL